MFRSTSTVCAFLLPIVGIILLGFSAKAATIEEKAKAARAYVGKDPTIKCGPKNSGDIVLPAVAMNQLKTGSVLVLTPGNYGRAPIRITANKVLITGDGSGRFCNVSLVITGRNCVVKDIWVSRITTSNDIVVVDSVINFFDAGRLTNKKSTHYFYNTCISFLRTPPHDMKVIMKKCTVAGGRTGIESGINPRFTISDCLITADDAPFHFDDKGGKNKVTMEHCRIYGKAGTIASKGRHNSSVAIDLKQLSRIANVFYKKDVQITKPIFLSNKYNNLGQFIQADDSPAKDVGIDPKLNILLSKYLENGGPTTTKPTRKPVPPRKTKPPPPRPKPPPKQVAPKPPAKPPKDDSDIGGIPSEPD